jgi:glucose/arabinose dehydrogenase
MRLPSTAILVAVVFALSATGRAQQAQPAAAPAVAGSAQVLDVPGGKVRVVTVATGLVHPWSISFLPDGTTMLVSERNGQLRVIRNGVLDPKPAWTAPTPPPPPPLTPTPTPAASTPASPPAARAGGAPNAQGQAPAAAGGRGRGGQGAQAQAQGQGQAGGDRLHWVTLHPEFAKNGLVYVSYPKQGERGSTLAIARGHFNGSVLGDVSEIFVADAWETGGNLAGKILFGPDNSLYVTVGDRDRICCNGTDDNSLRMKAQSLDNHVGKTLRLRDDGSVPPDNPFVGRAGARPEIFTYGHRNGYGLAFHPETRELWQVEIGPMGGDEMNILLPGHNYGWPLVSMGRNYTGTLASDESFFRKGMDNARMFWVPSISPSSLAFYTGDKFPRWKGSVLVGALNGQSVQRIAFGQPNQAERRDLLLRQLNVRFRDVVQGPDGFIYVATELASGGNNPDGTILRIEPAS